MTHWIKEAKKHFFTGLTSIWSNIFANSNQKKTFFYSVYCVHSYFEKGCRKNCMGYDQYTCSWHCSCQTYFCCFPLALADIRPWSLVSFFEISLNNSELKTTDPQYLSGLSRALFPTTFLETAVFKFRTLTCRNFWLFYFRLRLTLYECVVNVCIQR